MSRAKTKNKKVSSTSNKPKHAKRVRAKLRIKDALIIIVSALAWVIVGFITDKYNDPQIAYISSLLAATFILSILSCLIRKIGTGLLFYTFGAVIGFWINDIGIINKEKIIVFIIVGLLFETIILLTRKADKKRCLFSGIATIISAASIPLITTIVISPLLLIDLYEPILNITLFSALLALIGTALGLLIYMKLSTSKIFVKWNMEN